MKKSVKKLNILAVIFIIISVIMVFKGFDKMNNYSNPDSYYRDSVNAYVGGDAYNYIINGTYSTSYFTLASGCMISGILCIVGGMIINAVDNKEEQIYIKENTSNDELPPL